jgi:5-methylcytosine-specific restriction endonuclease McrA
VSRSEYNAYMQSSQWSRRRSRYFETHRKVCKACGVIRSIELHHKTYARLGNERDQDLVPLCHRCHLSLHRSQKKTGKNLWILTEEFVRKKQSRIKKESSLKKKSVIKQRKYRGKSNVRNKTQSQRGRRASY